MDAVSNKELASSNDIATAGYRDRWTGKRLEGRSYFAMLTHFGGLNAMQDFQPGAVRCGWDSDEPSTRDKVSAINESERRLSPTFAIEALAFDLG